jgi:hypothetical protein
MGETGKRRESGFYWFDWFDWLNWLAESGTDLELKRRMGETGNGANPGSID